jgi:hypothetical protein
MKEIPTETADASESIPGSRPGPSWILGSAFAAFQPNRLVLGTFLALLLGAIGGLADRIHDAVGGRPVAAVEVIRGMRGDGTFLPDRAFADAGNGPCASLAAAESMALVGLVEGILGLDPRRAIDAVGDAVLRAPSAAFLAAPWTMTAVAIVWMIAASLVGGGLARATALAAGRSVRIGARDAMASALLRWKSLVFAPVLPMVGAAICLAPVAILGLGFRVPVVEVLAAALYAVALFLGFLATFLAILGGLALPLMPASVACGDADAADAFVRNAAYLVRAPFLWLGSVGVAIVAFAVGFAVAATFAGGTLGLTSLVAGWAAGGLGEAEGRSAAVSAMLQLWDGTVQAILAGWIASFLFEASTRIYLTLRFRCDGQDPSTLDGVPLSAGLR